MALISHLSLFVTCDVLHGVRGYAWCCFALCCAWSAWCVHQGPPDPPLNVSSCVFTYVTRERAAPCSRSRTQDMPSTPSAVRRRPSHCHHIFFSNLPPETSSQLVTRLILIVIIDESIVLVHKGFQAVNSHPLVRQPIPLLKQAHTKTSCSPPHYLDEQQHLLQETLLHQQQDALHRHQ